MLRIDIYESRLEDGPLGHFVKSIGATETRPEAVALIEKYIEVRDHHGENGDHVPPYWWCRDDGDDKRQIIVITGV